ncbi:MAG: TIM barrel protein [Dongiaceae bacterium]
MNANGANFRQLSGTSDEHFRHVRQRLSDHRLRCDLETSDTSPAHMGRMLDVCCAIGVEQLRTYMRHAGSVRETIARTIDDLRLVAKRAEQAGIRILLENHEDFTGPELAEILAGVDNPWVAALYDYGNSMMVGEEPVTALSSILPYARSAHLKDHICLGPADASDGQMWIIGCPIGQGNLPIIEITQRLVTSGLDRLIMSSVWGYKAPLRGHRGDGVAGQGVFQFTTRPSDELNCPYGAEDLARTDPKRLVALEMAAVRWGQSWLRAALAEAGIEVAARADFAA